MNENKTNINWYPGHMAKAKRLMREKLELIDIIYEVVDARIPYSSKIKDVDNIIVNKPRILILTKMDLCDKNETVKWINYYIRQGYRVISFDLVNDKVDGLIRLTEEVLKDLSEKRIKKGMKEKHFRAMIIGIPNVGKSTLINRLAGKKKVAVGNKPGITKGLDWIRLNEKLDLMDTPGILWPKLDDDNIAFNLASTAAIKEEILPIDEVTIYILEVLEKYYPDKLKERYKIDGMNHDDIMETLNEIGRNTGCLVKGGNIDYDRVYSLVLNDIKDGRIKKITLDRME